MDKKTIQKYKWIYNTNMTPDEFEEKNTDYLVEQRLENNPHLAYMVNDGDLERYINDINRDYIKEIMLELYQDFLDEN